MIEEYKVLSVREQFLFLVVMVIIISTIIKSDILENETINSIAVLIGSGTILVLFTSPLIKIITKFRYCKLRFGGKLYFLNYLNLIRYWFIRLNKERRVEIQILKLSEEKSISLGKKLHKWFKNCEIEYYVNSERSNAKFSKLSDAKHGYDYETGNNNIIALLNTFIDSNVELLKSHGNVHKFISKEDNFLNIEKLVELNKIVSQEEEVVFLCSGRVYLNVQLGKYIQMLKENKRTKKASVLIYVKCTGEYEVKNVYK